MYSETALGEWIVHLVWKIEGETREIGISGEASTEVILYAVSNELSDDREDERA